MKELAADEANLAASLEADRSDLRSVVEEAWRISTVRVERQRVLAEASAAVREAAAMVQVASAVSYAVYTDADTAAAAADVGRLELELEELVRKEAAAAAAVAAADTEWEGAQEELAAMREVVARGEMALRETKVARAAYQSALGAAVCELHAVVPGGSF